MSIASFKKVLHRFGATILIVLLAEGISEAQKATADMIIYNAQVTTPIKRSSPATAVAVKDGKIIAVGIDKEIKKLTSIKTIKIDAHKRRMIPGLNDSHSHIIRGGRFYNLELRWDGITSLKQALDMLKEQAARTPVGEWVRVIGGWSEFQFEERRMPTIEEINAAVPDKPVFVLYLYGKGFVNRKGLEQLAINSTTPNPAGGLVEKDLHGNPTGLLIAEPNAFILYSTINKLPVLAPEDQYNSTRQFLLELNRLGVTSAIDAGGGGQNFPDDYAIVEQLAARDELTVRIPYYLFAQKPGSELDDYKRWIGMIDHSHDSELDEAVFYQHEGAGENLLWQAADFENFLLPRPELPLSMEPRLKEIVALLVKNRWPFRIHATYNESISRFLNLFEQINKEIPFMGLRWLIDHAETISEENIIRIKALGGGIAVQDRMAFQGESFIRRYGLQAASFTPPLQLMLKHGLPVGLGTDATRVSSYNPWVALYWAVTGKTIGGTELYPYSNRLTREEALRLFTKGSAWFSNEEAIKGSIEPGLLADFALLSDDFFTVEDAKILNIESVLTIVNGKVVYATDEFKSVAPRPFEASPAWSPVNFYFGTRGIKKKIK